MAAVQIVRELKVMGQALRPPRMRPRSLVGASVSSSELDARGIPSGRPGMGSPAKVTQSPVWQTSCEAGATGVLQARGALCWGCDLLAAAKSKGTFWGRSHR